MASQNRGFSQAAFGSAFALALLAGSVTCLAQAVGGAAAGATVPARERLAISALAVTGKVQFKSDAGATLAELKPGQALVEGAEIFTGVGSVVQIKVGTGQVFTIDRLCRVVIKEAYKGADGKETTLVQAPYGRLRFDVTSTAVANDVKIQAPDATLAVKGTHGVMEIIPGHPTRAYGGELNQGVFNVQYTGGVNVDVKRDYATSAASPAPARTADGKTFVQTADIKSADEKGEANGGWAPTAGGLDQQDQRTARGRYLSKFFPPIDPEGENPISGDVFVAVDARTGAVISIHDSQGNLLNVTTSLTGMAGTAQGAALVDGEQGPGVVVIDDTAGGGFESGAVALRGWTLGATKWSVLGVLNPLSVGVGGSTRRVGYDLDGLGNLGGTLYASGSNPGGDRAYNYAHPWQTTGNFGIFEIDLPSSGGGVATATQTMSFPMLASGGGLTGANDRGSMFASANWDLSDDSASGVVLLEIDPRTNFVNRVYSAADGDFGGAGPESADVPAGFVASGVAYVNGRVVVTGSAGGQPTTVTLRPAVANSPDRGGVESVWSGPVQGGVASNAIAGEGGFTAAAPMPVAAAERALPLVAGVDPLWVSAAYSRDAARSPAFNRMVRDTVLAVARDPARCAASAEIARLPGAVANYYGQANGVNSAIHSFLSELPADHPCRPNIPSGFGR